MKLVTDDKKGNFCEVCCFEATLVQIFEFVLGEKGQVVPEIIVPVGSC